MTLPLIAALRDMGPTARDRVEALFAAEEPADVEIQAVVEIVSEVGGLDYARRRGAEYAAEAEQSLAALPDTPARAALYDAVSYVTERNW